MACSGCRKKRRAFRDKLAKAQNQQPSSPMKEFKTRAKKIEDRKQRIAERRKRIAARNARMAMRNLRAKDR